MTDAIENKQVEVESEDDELMKVPDVAAASKDDATEILVEEDDKVEVTFKDLVS